MLPNSVSDAPAIAYPGQIAEAGAPRYCVSRRAEGTSVAAGLLMKRGTAYPQVEAVETGDTITTAMLEGIAVLSTSRAYDSDGIDAGADVEVMRLGVIYLSFAEAVTAGECVTVTLATGAFKAVAQGTAAGAIPTGDVMVPGLRVAQTISAAGVARVEVNLFGNQDSATIGSL